MSVEAVITSLLAAAERTSACTASVSKREVATSRLVSGANCGRFSIVECADQDGGAVHPRGPSCNMTEIFCHQSRMIIGGPERCGQRSKGSLNQRGNKCNLMKIRGMTGPPAICRARNTPAPGRWQMPEEPSGSPRETMTQSHKRLQEKSSRVSATRFGLGNAGSVARGKFAYPGFQFLTQAL